jgi:protein O-GlcNAc transferase
LDEAIASYRQALALQPDLPEAHNNLGNALCEKGQLDEAIAALRQAIALQPTDPEAHSNLVATLNCHPGFDAEAIAEEQRHWNRQHAEPLRSCIRPHFNERTSGRRLRIGYVSPDFHGHAVGRFLLPLLANHDHHDFEVFAYAQVPVPDAMTLQLRAHADQWHSLVGLSDEQAAALIRDHQIDILVDLALHTAHNRLLVFARKPAPVQVTYLAYAGSSGLRTMDYRLSDPFLDPPGMDQSAYSEQTIRLPQTYWCYQPVHTPPIAPLPALGAGHITFGCLNSFRKVNEPVLEIWTRLLRAVPQARLLLHAAEGTHRQRTADLLLKLGIDPRRLRFVGKVPLPEYVQLYGQIDIALDPFPYGGGTTTCDALWMSVPVISLRGNTAVGRAGLSLLSNIGLPELVAQTPEEYVRIAADLANDLPRLRALRSSLRTRMEQSPLMDAPRFARDVEAAYRTMWRQWCLEKTSSLP